MPDYVIQLDKLFAEHPRTNFIHAVITHFDETFPSFAGSLDPTEVIEHLWQPSTHRPRDGYVSFGVSTPHMHAPSSVAVYCRFDGGFLPAWSDNSTPTGITKFLLCDEDLLDHVVEVLEISKVFFE